MNIIGFGSVHLPGFDDLQSVDDFKIFGAARDKCQVGGQGNGCYLGVFGADRPACPAVAVHEPVQIARLPSQAVTNGLGYWRIS